MRGILAVALGGAVGAAGRYLLSLIPQKTGFPYLTLLTNFLGAVLIGFLVGLAGSNALLSSGKGLNGERLLFWKTGVCGGFTTFSTFSLEALTLLESGRLLTGGFYILLSVCLCLLGVAAGRFLALRLFPA